MADEDFQEEEVWSSFLKERKDARGKDHSLFSPSSSTSSSSSSSRRLSSASRLIPRASSNAEENGGRRQRKQSAPVNIPDWSKIYRSNSNGSVEENANDDGDEFDDDDEQLPPHEWIAKKMARSQISSFSVCEGAGRTLKGRDQTKVRNAVLAKTGFLD